MVIYTKFVTKEAKPYAHQPVSRGGCRGRPGGHVPPLDPGYTKKKPYTPSTIKLL